jgi:hypothetical protein
MGVTEYSPAFSARTGEIGNSLAFGVGKNSVALGSDLMLSKFSMLELRETFSDENTDSE